MGVLLSFGLLGLLAVYAALRAKQRAQLPSELLPVPGQAGVFHRRVPGGVLRLEKPAADNHLSDLVVTITPEVPTEATLENGPPLKEDERFADSAFDAAFHVPGPRPAAFARFGIQQRAAIVALGKRVRVERGVVSYRRWGMTDELPNILTALETIFAGARLAPDELTAALAARMKEEPVAATRLRLLHAIDGSAHAARVLLAGVDDVDPEVRLYAASAAPMRFLDIVRDDSVPERLREQALQAAAASSAAGDILAKLLESDASDDRLLAARLARLALRREALPTLRAWALDPSQHKLRQALLAAIVALDEDLETFALALLSTAHEEAKIAALDLLARVGTAVAAAAVQAHETAAEWPVRQAAKAALGAIAARTPSTLAGAVSVAEDLAGAVSLEEDPTGAQKKAKRGETI